MEVYKVFGLPAHPLIVHVPVVLVPLAALLVVLVLVSKTWRERLEWPLLAVTTVAVIGVFLATGTGEALEEHVERSPQLRHHTEIGGQMRPIMVLFFLAVVAWVLVPRWLAGRMPKTAGAAAADLGTVRKVFLALGALSLVLGAVSTYWIAKVGHNGAKVTWAEEGEKGEKGEAGG